MDIQRTLAENLKKLRKEKNLSQEELAEIADISERSIQTIETQQNWPRLDQIKAIAKALDVETDVLFSSRDVRPTVQQALDIIREAVERVQPTVPAEVMAVISKIRTNRQWEFLTTYAQGVIASEGIPLSDPEPGSTRLRSHKKVTGR